jgi:hypothetical protein
VNEKVGEFVAPFNDREERATWQKKLYRSNTEEPKKTTEWCKGIDSFAARMRRREPKKDEEVESPANLGDFLKTAGQQIVSEGTSALVMDETTLVAPKQRPPSARNDKRQYEEYMAGKTSCIQKEWDENLGELMHDWEQLRNFPVVKKGEEDINANEDTKAKPKTKEEVEAAITAAEQAVLDARAIKDYGRLGEQQKLVEELQAELVVVEANTALEKANKLHWALLRYGGMESELVDPKEWEAWEGRKGKLKEEEQGVGEAIKEEEEEEVAEKVSWMTKERRLRRDSHVFR